jgi:hypothetical protein
MVRKNEHYVKECAPEKGEGQPDQQLPTGYIPFYFFLKALFECHNAVPGVKCPGKTKPPAIKTGEKLTNGRISRRMALSRYSNPFPFRCFRYIVPGKP